MGGEAYGLRGSGPSKSALAEQGGLRGSKWLRVSNPLSPTVRIQTRAQEVHGAQVQPPGDTRHRHTPHTAHTGMRLWTETLHRSPVGRWLGGDGDLFPPSHARTRAQYSSENLFHPPRVRHMPCAPWPVRPLTPAAVGLWAVGLKRRRWRRILFPFSGAGGASSPLP